MTSRKDYQFAADWLARDAANGNDNSGAVRFAIAFFSQDNPRFDRARFEARLNELLRTYTAGLIGAARAYLSQDARYDDLTEEAAAAKRRLAQAVRAVREAEGREWDRSDYNREAHRA